MTREERLRICKTCKNKKKDLQLGLICGLTNNPADFDVQCPYYEQSEEEVKKIDYVHTNKPPKTWLTESILVTLFCCLPFGIAGIVNASKVESLYNSGQVNEALEASENAAKWVKTSFILGLVGSILYVIVNLAQLA